MISWFPSHRLSVPTVYFTPPLSSFLFSCSTNSSYLSSLFKIFPCPSLSPYFFKDILLHAVHTTPARYILHFLHPCDIKFKFLHSQQASHTRFFYCPSSSIDPKSTHDPSPCLQSGREDFSISLPFLPRRNQSVVSNKVHARMVL
jgi:hypothetical protein